jgi:RHS repeat-associated protein
MLWGGELSHEHDPFGNIIKTIDPEGSIAQFEYDRFGRMIYTNDPNLGVWNYRYNALGELVWQEDAKGQVAEMFYDDLGRLVRKIEPEGETLWDYDQGWLGELHRVTGPGYKKQFIYNSLGSVEREIHTITNGPLPGGGGAVPGGPVAIQNFSAYPTSFEMGGSVRISWDASNAFMCNAEGNLPGWSGIKQMSGVEDIFVPMSGSFQATLACEGSDGDVKKETLAINVIDPRVSISFSLSPVEVRVGDYVSLQWHAANATACTAGGTLPGWHGSIAVSGSRELRLTQRGEYIADINCTNPLGGDYALRELIVHSRCLLPILQPVCDILNPALLPGGDVNEVGLSASSVDVVENFPQESQVLPATVVGVERELYYEYDDQGRLSTIHYPSGLKVEKEYQRGVLTAIRNKATGAIYWSALDFDYYGNATSVRYGSGMWERRQYDNVRGHLVASRVSRDSTDATAVQSFEYRWDFGGNLIQRRNLLAGSVENFEYDRLNRLVNAPEHYSIEYDRAGNVTHKSSVGFYSYGEKPNAVSGVGSDVYSYDANGNMYAGGGRLIDWYSYNMPRRIERGSTYSEFLYGEKREKLRQVSYEPGSGGWIGYYFGPLYEERHAAGIIEKRHYIRTRQGVVAVEAWKAFDSEVEYWHKDHLDSVALISGADRNIVQCLSFAPHGERGPCPGQGNYGSLSTGRGFGGHEHLKGLGLIHMNGRVYDNTLGRFISPDPFVQFPNSTQGLNRYAYVSCRVSDECLVHNRRPLLLSREVLRAALAEWNEAREC